MSKHETPLIREYWKSVGGSLIEEFLVLKRGRGSSQRIVDAVIIPDGENKIMRRQDVSLEGKDVIVVQAKAKRLGMNLLGQALFSKLLLEKYFNPKSVRSIALCTKNDIELQSILEENFSDVEVMIV